MCYYKILKQNSHGRRCKCYVKLAKRPEKREANDNFIQEKAFVEYMYKWTDNTVIDENQQW